VFILNGCDPQAASRTSWQTCVTRRSFGNRQSGQSKFLSFPLRLLMALARRRAVVVHRYDGVDSTVGRLDARHATFEKLNRGELLAAYQSSRFDCGKITK
jgi:hypothetical protein